MCVFLNFKAKKQVQTTLDLLIYFPYSPDNFVPFFISYFDLKRERIQITSYHALIIITTWCLLENPLRERGGSGRLTAYLMSI